MAMKFGRAHARIAEQILPAFSENMVAAARREAEVHTLYLPPEARQ